MNFRDLLTEKSLTPLEKIEKIAIIKTINGNGVLTFSNVELKGGNITGKVVFDGRHKNSIAIWKKFEGGDRDIKDSGKVVFLRGYYEPQERIFNVFKAVKGLPFDVDKVSFSSRDVDKKWIQLKDSTFTFKLKIADVYSLDSSKRYINKDEFKKELANVTLPTKVKKVKDEISLSTLGAIGVSVDLAKFLMTQEITNVNKLDYSVIKNFLTEFKLTDRFSTTAKVEGLVYIQVLLNIINKDFNELTISGVPKTHLNPFVVYDYKTNKVFEFDKDIYESEQLSKVIRSKNNNFIKAWVNNNRTLNKYSKDWVDKINISNYLETEIDFTIELMDTLDNVDSIKKGEIYFGIGSTRRDQFNALVSGNWIKEIQDGSTKYISLPNKKSGASDKAELKSIARDIKSDTPNEAPNGYGQLIGVGIEDKKVLIHYTLSMAYMRDKNEFGGPTQEYDNKILAAEAYYVELAKELSSKYDVKVIAIQNAGFGGRPENLIESTFRSFLSKN